jgi:Spy/CpxP family protein refolding chaperone
MKVRQIPQRARRLALTTAVGAVVVGSVALAPSASAQSQDPQGSTSGERMDPRQMIDLRMARMTETLKLDSAQQTKIRSIIADETMAMEDLRKNGGGQRGGGGDEGGGRRSGGREGGRGGGRRGGGGAPPDSTGGGSGGAGPSPEVRAIRERTNKQIEAVLNPQQLTTFRQLFEQGQQQRPARDSATRRRGGSS